MSLLHLPNAAAAMMQYNATPPRVSFGSFGDPPAGSIDLQALATAGTGWATGERIGLLVKQGDVDFQVWSAHFVEGPGTPPNEFVLDELEASLGTLTDAGTVEVRAVATGKTLQSLQGELITADVTLYVDSAGDDANSGAVGAPLATLSGALGRVERMIVPRWVYPLPAVTINLAAGQTFTEDGSIGPGLTLSGLRLNGATVNIVGGAGTIIDTGASSLYTPPGCCGSYAFSTLEIQGDYGPDFSGAVNVSFTDVQLTATAVGQPFYVMASNGARVRMEGIAMAGDIAGIAYAACGGTIDMVGSFEFIGSPAFSQAGVQAYNGGVVMTDGVTVTGTVTGQRYISAYGGIINTWGGGAEALPGTVAGVAVTGAYY